MVRAVPPDMVLRLVEDPEFRYEDFAPRGEQAPPTMRAQVWRQCVQVHECCFDWFIPLLLRHTVDRLKGLSHALLLHLLMLLCAGLFLGGPWLLSGQQTAARYGPVPG